MGIIKQTYYSSIEDCGKLMVDEIYSRLKMLAGVLLGDRFNITRDIIMEHTCNDSAMRVEDYLLSSADAIGKTMVAARITFTQQSYYVEAEGEIFEDLIYAFIKEIGK